MLRQLITIAAIIIQASVSAKSAFGEEESIALIPIKRIIQEMRKKECDNNLVTNYIELDERLGGVSTLAERSVSKMCPHLKKTCCPYKQLEQLDIQYKLGRKSFLRTLDLFNKIVRIFKEVGHEKMVYMVYEKEKTLNENERLDSWHEQRTTTVDYIYQNLEQAKIK